MAQSSEQDREDEWVTARVDPAMKRAIGMRAQELGLNKTEYLLSLVRDDLSDVDYVDI